MNADGHARELLIAGAKSYPQVLLALNEFSKHIFGIVEEAVSRDRDEIAESMTIKISAGDVKPKFKPDGFHYGEIQGEEVRIGVVIMQEKAQGWKLNFEFYWENCDEKDCNFGFMVRVNNKYPIQKEKMIEAFKKSTGKLPDVYKSPVVETSLRMRRLISPDEMGKLPNIVREAIVEWCAVWERIGGLKQFLAKAQETGKMETA
jgi:hypothetical protein